MGLTNLLFQCTGHLQFESIFIFWKWPLLCKHPKEWHMFSLLIFRFFHPNKMEDQILFWLWFFSIILFTIGVGFKPRLGSSFFFLSLKSLFSRYVMTAGQKLYLWNVMWILELSYEILWVYRDIFSLVNIDYIKEPNLWFLCFLWLNSLTFFSEIIIIWSFHLSAMILVARKVKRRFKIWCFENSKAYICVLNVQVFKRQLQERDWYWP